MVQDGRNSQAANEAQVEGTKLQEVEALLRAFDILQDAFSSMTSQEDRQQAEGRRCVIGTTGLKYHKKAFYFEVVGSRLSQVDPYEKYNTLILAPLDTIIAVLKGTLSGDENAFVDEWRRGRAKLVGDHSIHDGDQFQKAFQRLAWVAKRYRQFAGPP